MPPQSSAPTTPLPQTVYPLDQLQKYETGSLNNQVNSANATLTIDHKFTDQSKIQQWAILIDTGASAFFISSLVFS
eukprot:5552367-Amphidinium_carterae.1